MFHVRRRPADGAPRKRKKKPGAIGQTAGTRDVRGDAAPLLVELGPDGSAPHPGDTARTIRLTNDVMEVGSANGIALQLYGPHIQPRHCVITINAADGVTSLTPCNADAHTYVNGQRIHQTTALQHGSLVKFGHSNTYRFLDPAHEDRSRPAFGSSGGLDNGGGRMYESRSPRALSPADPSRDNIETTFDLEGNVETISTASGPREDNRSLGSSSENRLSGIDRYPRGQDPILPAVLEFPEESQEQFLARVISHLDVTTPTFRLAPAYTLYLCARYRASTHYRPELTPTERAHKLTLLLQHAAMLIRYNESIVRRSVQDRITESYSQAFWLANASELLHFLKSDRHVSAFSLQAQDTLADAVQVSFTNLVAYLTDELNSAMSYLMSVTGDDHPREVINILSGAMNLLRKCRVNAALTIQLFSQLFHWVSAKALSNVISNSNLCTRNFGNKLFNRLRNLQAWAESQGLELAAECHLAKIVQCAHLLQAPKYAPEDLANLSAACFKLNSMQLGALLMQYKAEPGEKLASPSLLEQAAKAAEGVADELARAEGREVTLYEDPAPPLQLLLPDDGFSCDVVQGVPPGLADFLHPLQASGLCRLAAQPTSSGHWTVYMSAPRPPSALSATQPEVQVIRLHKSGGGMGLSIVAAKGAGQERLGIYIKSVVPGGAADRDGRLAAGDQLLTVDGQSLLGITQEKAAEFLQRTSSIVTLEVAKAGAVYHGLATLLQQPSPTPHRAMDNYYYYSYDTAQGSIESLYSPKNFRMFTPPVNKPKNNIFFSSDDSLFKSEKRKFTIPRIEIESDEPVFNLQVTDFSDPAPKNVTLTYDETGTAMQPEKVEEFCVKPTSKTLKENFAQQKSYSIEVNESLYDIDDINERDKFLSIGARRSRQQGLVSSSLQDLSSSTSSINSGVHESNLDLSQIDPDTPVRTKNWRSPYEIRHRNVNDLSKKFEDKATSVPFLNRQKYVTSRSKSVSEERLNDKLTDYERLEILKLLYDWSVVGSESKSDFNMKLSSRCVQKKAIVKKDRVKFSSEPDLSPKSKQNSLIVVTKFFSDDSLNKKPNMDQFYHKCEYRNCIFNVGTKEKDFKAENTTNTKPKSILKQSKDPPEDLECLNNITNLQNKPKYRRRHSEIIDLKPFDSQLVRCDSLERLNDLQKKHHRKFPDSYIVTRRNSARKSVQKTNNENINSPKFIVLKKKYLPKSWKSCSDIKSKKTVRKCCRYAKKSCPVLKNCSESPKSSRKTRSCACIEGEDNAARLDALKDIQVGAAVNRPRRMSERDLPSKVDSERTIPSSKSVPALHQIHSQGVNDHPAARPNYDAYSRTSSNNSINNNNNGQPIVNGGPTVSNAALRSRSTHNLHQQDGGFYQNLSIYRNKIPSPQHLGDRTSALRSSQNSLHSSVANSQRPSSAYYPPPTSATPRPNNLHQSIPNLKSPPSTHRLNSDENSRTVSYPNVQYGQNYYPPHMKNSPEEVKVPYSNPYMGQNQPYPSPTHSSGQGYSNNVQQPLHVNPNNVQQPLHVNPNMRQDDRVQDIRFNNGGGLLREDVFRQSQTSRHDEMMRYPSQGNIRVAEAQIQQNDTTRYSEMRTSKSDDLLKQHTQQQNDMMRYASSGNIRESNKVDIPQIRQNPDHLPQHRLSNEDRHLRGVAKIAEMSEEVRRRQNRVQYVSNKGNSICSNSSSNTTTIR
ncbi:hypothetical protein JTB14_030180 [Gonioctena quinquepunctata]|nr:hypothetical protein JTB14_030180 [Gonioctena quinquepunctata]